MARITIIQQEGAKDGGRVYLKNTQGVSQQFWEVSKETVNGIEFKEYYSFEQTIKAYQTFRRLQQGKKVQS